MKNVPSFGMNAMRTLAVSVAAIIGAMVTLLDYSARAVSPCPVPVIVHADGLIEFDGTRISDDRKLTALLAQYRKQNPKCAMRISADEVLSFQAVGRVIAAMQKAGYLKVGFLTEVPK